MASDWSKAYVMPTDVLCYSTDSRTISLVTMCCATFTTRSPSASCLIYARALLEYVIIIMWLRSVVKMLRSEKFAVDKVLTFFILREKC